MVRTSATELAGKPAVSACWRISAASSRQKAAAGRPDDDVHDQRQAPPTLQRTLRGGPKAHREGQLAGVGDGAGDRADAGHALAVSAQGGARCAELCLQAPAHRRGGDGDRAVDRPAVLPPCQPQRFDERAFRDGGGRAGARHRWSWRFTRGDRDRPLHFFRVDGADEGVGAGLHEGAGSAPGRAGGVDGNAAAARLSRPSRPVDPMGGDGARVAEGDGPAGGHGHAGGLPGESGGRFGRFDRGFVRQADRSRLQPCQGNENEQEQPPAMPSPRLSTPGRCHPLRDTAPEPLGFNRPAVPAQ